MAIEKTDGGVVITGAHIEFARLVALRGALRLEIAGMQRRGRSANVIACELLGLKKGTSKQVTFDHLNTLIEAWKAADGGAQ